MEELFSEYCSKDPVGYGDALAREVLMVFIESYAREAGLDPGDIMFHVPPGVASYRLGRPAARGGDGQPWRGSCLC